MSETQTFNLNGIDFKLIDQPSTVGDRVLIETDGRRIIGDYFPCNCGACAWVRVRGEYERIGAHKVLGVLTFDLAA